MSYILNALKHSENQRNRGEIPHIDSQPEFVKAPANRWSERTWKWLALTLVLILLVGLVWLRAGEAPSTPEQAPAGAEAPAAAPEPAPPPAQQQAPGLPALENMAGVRIRLDDAPAVETQPPVPGMRESPRIVLELPLSGGVTPRPAPPVAPAPAADAPLAAPVVRETAPAETLSGVSHWKTLPSEAQQQLRELAFTAHVYSGDAAARFIRVSGRTLREGDRLNAELQLQQITRDGVVLGYRGDKFWFGFN